MSDQEMGGTLSESERNQSHDDIDRRLAEAQTAFCAKYPWIREGATFRFNNFTPKPLDGLYIPDVYSHDFSSDTFTVDSFYKSPDGQTVTMSIKTQIDFTLDNGSKIKPKITFDLSLSEIENLELTEVADGQQ